MTNIRTSFTISDGENEPVVLDFVKAWECESARPLPPPVALSDHLESTTRAAHRERLELVVLNTLPSNGGRSRSATAIRSRPMAH